MNISRLILPTCCAIFTAACATHPGSRAPEPASATVLPGAVVADNDTVHRQCYTSINNPENKPDYQAAYKWCKIGAERGIPSSQVLFAQLHMNGNDIPKDLPIALEWYDKAGRQEHPFALLTLYRMHAVGEGTPKDGVKAVAFLRRAAAAKLPTAVEELERVENMPATEKRRASALNGDVEAQSALGIYHSWGPLLVRDPAQAVSWYEKASEAGWAQATNNLADLYETGEGVPRDYPKAVKLYRKAAATGYYVSLYSLATMYASGQGLEQNNELAYLYARLTILRREGGHFEEQATSLCKRLAGALAPARIRALDAAADKWAPGQALPLSVASL